MTDWNDLHVEEGLQVAQAEVERQLATASPLNNAPPDFDDDLLNPPPIMAREAYHGILFDVVKVACKTSEASPVAVAANFLATFSAMVGRVTFQHIGDGTDSVTNGRFQESEFNGSFPAMSLKSGRSTPHPNRPHALLTFQRLLVSLLLPIVSTK